MNSLWEWKYCDKCNIWTEHYSETGGDRCNRCQTVSPPFKNLSENEQKRIKLEQEVKGLLKNFVQEDNTEEEGLEKISKLIIKWVKKNL